MSIKAVVIDVFSTLVSAPNLIPDLTVPERLADEYKLVVTPEQVRQAIGRYWELAEQGSISDYYRWHQILKQLGIREPSDDLIYDCILLETEQVIGSCRPLPHMREVLLATQHHLPLAVLTNASPIHLALELRLELDELPTVFLASCLEMLSKASPDFFLLAAAELHVDPADCLYIDDSLAHLKTAKSLGMTTVLALTAPETRAKLNLLRDLDANNKPDFIIDDLLEITAEVLPACGVPV